jgi:hypothetical protein
MMQLPDTFTLSISLVFIFLGLFSFGWLVVHVEHSRHRSMARMIMAIAIGAILIGFGIHFLLLSLGF